LFHYRLFQGVSMGVHTVLHRRVCVDLCTVAAVFYGCGTWIMKLRINELRLLKYNVGASCSKCGQRSSVAAVKGKHGTF
jgi:hypothetical protein